MTNYEKRANLEKRYYKAIEKGNYAEADKLMKKLVDMDVASCKKVLGK